MTILTWLATVASCAVALAAAAQPASFETGPFKGRTVDAEGRPIGGVTVQQYAYRHSPGNRFELEPGPESTSDASGNFELAATQRSVLPHAPTVVVARKPGWSAAWSQFTATSGENLRVVLPPPSFLAGQVVDENDKPVANATVFLVIAYAETPGPNGSRSFAHLSDKPARDLFNARTGLDGKFRLEGFPTNSGAVLAAEAPGKAPRALPQEFFNPDSMPCRAGQEDIRLVVEPSGSIEGKIVTEPLGDLPPAQLHVMPGGPGVFLGPRQPTVAKSDGAFRMNDLPAGAYRVQATFGTNAAPDWVAESVPVNVESGRVSDGVLITAIRGGALEVFVRTANDAKPISGAGVGVYKDGFQANLASGPDGLVRFRLPPGEYQVNASSAGWQLANGSGSVQTGQTNRVDLELTPVRKLTGLVHWPDGMPAAGLAVQVVGSPFAQPSNVRTGADGRFQMDWDPQSFPRQDATPCVLIRAPDRNLAVAHDIDEDAQTIELRLAPAVSFSARVECDGKPVTNATANLLFRAGNMGLFLSDMSSSTSAPGQVDVVALPPGRKYGLQISAPGHGSKFIDLESQAEEAKHVELDPVQLRRADRKLAGKLVDTDEKPVAGATVQVQGEGQPNASSRTDRDGRFSFDVCEGTVRLFAHSGRSFANASADAGDTNVVLTLGEQSMGFGGRSKPQKVKGTVTGPDGKPAPGAEVRVFLSEMPARIKTDTNGAFQVAYVIPPWQRQNGNPLLIIRDRARNLAAVHELSDESTNVTVQLEPGLAVKGQVVDQAGKPLARAQLNLILQTGRMGGQVDDQPLSADAQGRFKIEALPVSQDYSLYASLPGYSQKQQKIDSAGEGNVADLPPIVLRRADRVIAGRVVDAKDKPVSGAYVQVSSDDQPQSNMQTDGKGRFKFNVCDGQVRMYANGQNGFAQVMAQAGDTNVLITLIDPSTRRPTGQRRAVPGVKPNPHALQGKPLPSLSSLGFAPDIAPRGKPVLLCLMDVQQRPSRRTARLLAAQDRILREKGVTVIAAQTVQASDETWDDWKEAYAIPFELTRIAERSDDNLWASSLEELPWLVLVDKDGIVRAEGFSLDELDGKLADLER